MTDYTDLKARLREALDVRLSLNEKIIPVGEAEVKRILAAIEELERERDKLHMENETMRGFLGWTPEQRITHEEIDVLDAAFRKSVKLVSAAPAAEHVAWCRYVNHNGRRPTEIKLCDSDSPGAFKVYAAPQAAPAPEPVAWRPLTDEDRRSALEAMPDWLGGFLKKWGWLNFAKEIERRCMEKNKAAPQPAQAEEEQ